MIAFQFTLLYVCLKYQPAPLPTSLPPERRTSNTSTALLDDTGTGERFKYHYHCGSEELTLRFAICRPVGSLPKSMRPYNLWQWQSYGVGVSSSANAQPLLISFVPKTYIEFVAAVIGVNTLLYMLLSGLQTYVDVIGLVALGLESTVGRSYRHNGSLG